MKTFLEVLGVILGFAMFCNLMRAGGECKSEQCERLGHTWAC